MIPSSLRGPSQRTVRLLLSVFGEASGLKMSLQKSRFLPFFWHVLKLGSAMQRSSWSTATANALQVSWLSSSLGCITARDWTPILERMEKHLQGVLLSSVVSALLMYYLSLMRIPDIVLKSIDSFRRKFIWGKPLVLEITICPRWPGRRFAFL
jgi:hypothetical protein